MLVNLLLRNQHGEYSKYFISGPEDDYDIPHESIGKIIFDGLKKKNPEEVVDAITGNALTCGELLESSIKLTSIFGNIGIKRGDVIAIVSENILSYSIPLLASLYMGVILNPLNPAYTIGELKHGLEVSKAKLIVCTKSALQTVLATKKELDFVETVLLMGPQSEDNTTIGNIEDLLKMTIIDTHSFAPNEFDYSKQDAFIFLSSGTTGLPKGVLLTHKNIRSAIGYLGLPNYGNLVSGDVTIQILPCFHIAGLLLHLGTLSGSIRSIFMDKFMPDAFLKCIEAHRVTKLHIVTPILLFLIQSPLVKKYDLSSIEDILVGGSPVGTELQNKARKRFNIKIVRQIYGLTETAGVCTFETPERNKAGSIGVLIPGIVAKISDPERNVAVGPYEIGELCFKGSMIMKGYVGNTKATDACIVKDGFYHTGDVGYYDDEKFFFISDRMKELIKYKGFQVSPAELEALIVSHPGVKEVHRVLGIPDERAGQLPLAFVVRQTGSNVTAQEIIDFVAGKISIHKRLYGGVRFIDEIPKNSFGKMLRRELLEIYQNTL